MFNLRAGLARWKARRLNKRAIQANLRASDKLRTGYVIIESKSDGDIFAYGVEPGDDGRIHMFGNVSCALAYLEQCEAAHDAPMSVWKVDITGLNARIDALAEPISMTCRLPQPKGEGMEPDHDINEFCHGYVITVPLPPNRVVSKLEYVWSVLG